MKELLLDTHVWIWLMQGTSDLTAKYKKIINDAAKNTGVYISIISTWEICMLEIKNRIILEKLVLAWIKEALALPGIELKQLTPEIVADSCSLPENNHFHGDPADRLIIATARLHSLTLLTHDKKIIAYGKQNHVSVIPV